MKGGQQGRIPGYYALRGPGHLHFLKQAAPDMGENAHDAVERRAMWIFHLRKCGENASVLSYAVLVISGADEYRAIPLNLWRLLAKYRTTSIPLCPIKWNQPARSGSG